MVQFYILTPLPPASLKKVEYKHSIALKEDSKSLYVQWSTNVHMCCKPKNWTHLMFFVVGKWKYVFFSGKDYYGVIFEGVFL